MTPDVGNTPMSLPPLTCTPRQYTDAPHGPSVSYVSATPAADATRTGHAQRARGVADPRDQTAPGIDDQQPGDKCAPTPAASTTAARPRCRGHRRPSAAEARRPARDAPPTASAPCPARPSPLSHRRTDLGGHSWPEASPIRSASSVASTPARSSTSTARHRRSAASAAIRSRPQACSRPRSRARRCASSIAEAAEGDQCSTPCPACPTPPESLRSPRSRPASGARSRCCAGRGSRAPWPTAVHRRRRCGPRGPIRSGSAADGPCRSAGRRRGARACAHPSPQRPAPR